MKRAKNTRTLTLRTDCHFIRERGQGLRTLRAGNTVAVSFSPGTGFGTAFFWDGGAHWSSCITAEAGPDVFKNWPKDWKATT